MPPLNMTLLVLVMTAINFASALASSSVCCSQVSIVLGHKVSFPGSTAYNSSLTSYWSQQERLVYPSCIVSPTTVQDVSTAVRTLTRLSICKFAIRSGGHTAHAGSANIKGGVTIDLTALQEIAISADRGSVVVGPGQRWENVYAALQPYNASVAGGRAGTVGVGGSTLGGGIGYFAPKAGFACDNVLSFQVVLANGSIINANATSHFALYRALKGGSNNFGIVTRYTFRTFEQGLFYVGNVIYPATTVLSQITAFSEFISNRSYDDNAAIMQSFGFSPSVGAVIVNQPVYAKPIFDPPIFKSFLSIQPQLSNTRNITDLASFSAQDAQMSAEGLYQLTFATSFDQSVDMLTQLYDLWNASTSDVADISGIVWSISMQPLNHAIVSKAAATGGNSLGLPSTFRSGSLVLALLSATWNNEKDSASVQSAANDLLAKIIWTTKRAGSFNPYIDLNHANGGQDVIAGYGPDVQAKLRFVASNYDPFGFFQWAVPGGFKLNIL